MKVAEVVEPVKILRSRYAYYVCECGKKLATDRPFCKYCGREIAWDSWKGKQNDKENKHQDR